MPYIRPATVGSIARLVATDFLEIEMKEGIHPKYREVAFTDMSIGETFIIRSTAEARDEIEIDGKSIRRLSWIPLPALILSTPVLRHVSLKQVV